MTKEQKFYDALKQVFIGAYEKMKVQLCRI